MFRLHVKNFYFDSSLQIVQGDVYLCIDNQEVINETLCIDIGLPSLVRSILKPVQPNRWSEEWEDMPFFVCGCGDPDCKAYSFIVRHPADEYIELTEIEESGVGDFRIYQRWSISRQNYIDEIIRSAEEFLDFVKPLDYEPFFPQSVENIQEMVDKIKSQSN